MRNCRPRLNPFAVVNRLYELRRHHAAFQPFAPQSVNNRPGHIGVKPDAWHERPRETISTSAIVTVNLVRVIRAVIFSDHFVTGQILSDLESAHFFFPKIGLIGLMGLIGPMGHMCLRVSLSPCLPVSDFQFRCRGGIYSFLVPVAPCLLVAPSLFSGT